MSHLYVPTGPPDPSGRPVALREVGTFTPVVTGTPNGLGIAGNLLVTGGANAPDRTSVALRTYSDAYVWDVPDRDVVQGDHLDVATDRPVAGRAAGRERRVLT